MNLSRVLYKPLCIQVSIILLSIVTLSACSEPFSFDIEESKIIIIDGEISTERGESYIRIFKVLDYNQEFSIADMEVRVISDDGETYDFRYSDDDKFYCSTDFYFAAQQGSRYRMEATNDDGVLIQSSYDSVPMSIPFDILIQDTTILQLTEFGVLVEKRAVAAVASFPSNSIDFFSKLNFRYSYKDFFSEQRIGVSDPNEFTLHRSVGLSSDQKEKIVPVGYKLIAPWQFFNSDFRCDTIPLIPCQLPCCATTDFYLVDFEISLESTSKEAYEYWQNVQKLTKNDGLVFDTYPFPLNGNVFCENCENQVVGFFRTVSKSFQSKSKSI